MKPQASYGKDSAIESRKIEPKCDALRKNGVDQAAHVPPADAVSTCADHNAWALQVQLEAWRHIVRWGK